jgi:hypothetical protein
MKRIIVLMISLLLLAGCQPTPEKEFVVNKGDHTIEEKLNATPKPILEDTVAFSDATAAEGVRPGQQFPAHWDAEPVEVSGGFTISVDAEIVTKADGRYPVYRTKAVGMSKERAAALAEKILGKPVGMGDYVMTKEDWKRALEWYLAEVDAWEAWVAAGKPDDGIDRDDTGFPPEEVERVTNDYMEHIKTAPDETTVKTVTDYSGLEKHERKIYTLADGSKANIFLFDNFVTIAKTAGMEYLYTAGMHEMEMQDESPNANKWKPAAITREQAEATLMKELKKLELTEYTVKWVTEANLMQSMSEMDLPSYVSSGWSFMLHRNPADYPESSVQYGPSQLLNYGTSDEYVSNRPIDDETITAYISENGLEYFSFIGPREVTGIANPDVELLPFEEVQDRAIRSLTMCFPLELFNRTGRNTVSLEIYRMLLTTYTIYEKNGDGYLEMPCWIVFFDGENVPSPETIEKMGLDPKQVQETRMKERNDVTLYHEVLVLNAVDGSIIHTDYGY